MTIELAPRVVHKIVPLSILVYISAHLGNPKLAKCFRKLAETTNSSIKRLFYKLLIFSQKPKESLKDLKKMITPESSVTEDFIICGFLRWYCHENKVENEILDNIVAVVDSVRMKYAKRVKEDMPMLKDTFRPDLKKQLQAKHVV